MMSLREREVRLLAAFLSQAYTPGPGPAGFTWDRHLLVARQILDAVTPLEDEAPF